MRANYLAEDSLAYLADSAIMAIDAAVEQIQDVHGACPEFEDLPANLQDAIYILDEVRDKVRGEALAHNTYRATHYSNGIAIRRHYKGKLVEDDLGNRYHPDCITTVHPSGKFDGYIPPQPSAA